MIITKLIQLDDGTDRALDEHGMYPGEAEAELSKYLETIEAQLSPFTSEQLNDEIYRRMFEPFNAELERLRDTINNLTAPF